MTSPIDRYLLKRANLAARPLVAGSLEGVETLVVIPAMAEHERLPATIESLALNPPADLAATLVIVVVNNGADSNAEVRDNNRATLDWLRTVQADNQYPVRIAYIDAATGNASLPDRGGVGLARKVGMDWGAEVLRRNDRPRAPILCLDADTTVDGHYLPAVREHFRAPDAWATVIDYAHRAEGPAEQRAAIVLYEIFLRCHVLGLAWAGSPYAFHTIGSAMVCTVEAYCAVSGMNSRRAGEDFYFLQQLAKTGSVASLRDTVVHPAGRASNRVPFGTGRQMMDVASKPSFKQRLYNPANYTALRYWLRIAQDGIGDSGETLLGHAADASPPVASFLKQRNFAQKWDRIRAQTSDPARLQHQFDCLFDGFETLKLFHHLRDNDLPDLDVINGAHSLLTQIGHDLPPFDTSTQQYAADLLHHLRNASAKDPNGK
ncbi:MAG: hypothetical protein AAB353_05260 [Candidatus Hydrogenedentota bacterium]